jgi:hypothetical protein
VTTSGTDKTKKASRAALRSPSGDVIPGVLDVPIDEEAHTRSRGVDWVVFGVTAIIAIAFLLWVS